MNLGLFISNSDEDVAECNKIINQLEKLLPNNIEVWYYKKNLGTGTDYETIITDSAFDAEIALMLVSSHYLESEFCRREREIFQEVHARPLPLILSKCDWQADAWLGSLQVFPPGNEATYLDLEIAAREKALLTLTDEIRRIIIYIKLLNKCRFQRDNLTFYKSNFKSNRRTYDKKWRTLYLPIFQLYSAEADLMTQMENFILIKERQRSALKFSTIKALDNIINSYDASAYEYKDEFEDVMGTNWINHPEKEIYSLLSTHRDLYDKLCSATDMTEETLESFHPSVELLKKKLEDTFKQMEGKIKMVATGEYRNVKTGLGE
ncbi:MAG: toll/interleukin-1 receptor domain-containing protein [Candidatus Thiodiazotropha sp. (ex Ctena orbiculata)]|nr:toll/interleukin-1 receptor domain-containing protein [Candidatus Thiodiazotropha taylori]